MRQLVGIQKDISFTKTYQEAIRTQYNLLQHHHPPLTNQIEIKDIKNHCKLIHNIIPTLTNKDYTELMGFSNNELFFKNNTTGRRGRTKIIKMSIIIFKG